MANQEKLAIQRAAMHACALAPHDPQRWSNLGCVHARAEEFDLAIPCFMEAIDIDPRFADGWHNLGLALSKLGRDGGALTAFKNALRIDATCSMSWIVLGELLLKCGQEANALHCFDRAAQIDPDLARARSRLGEYYLERGRAPRAEALFRRAITLDRRHLAGWIGLGRALEDRNEPDAARAAYLQALRRQPEQGAALSHYISLLSGRDDVDGEETAHRLTEAKVALSQTQTPDETRAQIGYALAKYHDQRREFDAAAVAGTVANLAYRRIHGGLNREQLHACIDGLIATYDREFFIERRRFGTCNDQLVFIVGLPRSGAKLTEQLLANHPELHCAGEVPNLAKVAQQVVDSSEDTWRAASRIDEIDSHVMADDYLRALHTDALKRRRRIIDRAPLNFLHLPLVAVLFPGAHIIHCQRDIRDLALSLWLENSNTDRTYATDFDDLAFFMAEYRRLMAHWRAVLPLPMIDVIYEDTVEDIELQARRLTDFLDVPWSERCLEFPPRWTAPAPAVGRWRNYVDRLPGLGAAFPQP